MKSNLLALLGAVVGFSSGFLISYKLQSRRRPRYCSFWELYDDNAVAMDWGE